MILIFPLLLLSAIEWELLWLQLLSQVSSPFEYKTWNNNHKMKKTIIFLIGIFDSVYLIHLQETLQMFHWFHHWLVLVCRKLDVS